jgi:hypothetical protein
MNTRRPPSLTSLLLISLAMTACEVDPELEFDADELELDEPATDDEQLDELGLEAPSNEQTVSSCNLGLPDSVIHQLFRIGHAYGSLDGISSGNYSFEVTPSPNNPGPLQSWVLFVDDNVVKNDSNVVIWPPFSADDGDPIDFKMMAFSTAQVGWVYEFQLDLYSEPNHQLLCSDTTSMEVQPDCPDVDYWWTTPAPQPWYDGANCYVAPLPEGVTPFVWGNNWYVEPGPGNSCAIGQFDSANCYIGSAPWGNQAFMWGGAMYFEL